MILLVLDQERLSTTSLPSPCTLNLVWDICTCVPFVVVLTVFSQDPHRLPLFLRLYGNVRRREDSESRLTNYIRYTGRVPLPDPSRHPPVLP